MHVLTDMPQITWVSSTTGPFDIVVGEQFATTKDLYDFLINAIRSLEGLKDTQTFICLNVKKGSQIPFL